MKTIKNLKADEIRKSILQLAIQGKLVKQDPNDEPASELVKRIYAEKQKLIKEGKIKKDKNESFIFKGDDNCYYEKIGNNEPIKIEDLPFDIPDNWTWIRFKTAGTIEGGFTPKNDELSNQGNVPYFKVSDMNAPGNEKYMAISFLYYLGNKKLFSPNSIIFPKNGGALFTNKKRILSKHSVVDLNIGVFTPSNCFNFDFIFTIFQSIDFRKYSKGTALPTVDKDKVERMYLAIPPLNEQKRIVKKIKSFEPLIVQYEDTEEKLSILEREFPKRLKQSILQYAIEGKLVKQDPNDEPASVLLERIRAEKERLIREGKIKRDKNESYIYQGDDKNYYENLPQGWEFVPLGKLGTLTRGSGIKRSETTDHGLPCIRYGELYTTYKTSFVEAKSYTTNEVYNKSHKIQNGDVLMSLTGENKEEISRGLAYLGETPVAMGGDMTCLSNHKMNPLFLVYVLNSPYGINIKRQLATGDIIVHMSNDRIASIGIPVPPYEEQLRIKEQINNLFELIE